MLSVAKSVHTGEVSLLPVLKGLHFLALRSVGPCHLPDYCLFLTGRQRLTSHVAVIVCTVAFIGKHGIVEFGYQLNLAGQYKQKLLTFMAHPVTEIKVS